MDNSGKAPPGVSIPVVEERLQVSKKKVRSAVVKIEKAVEARDYIVSDSLETRNAVIERFAKGVEVDRNNPPRIREENGVTIIPVFEEVLVVEKRLVLKEELHVRAEVSESVFRQRVTLKKERLIVKRSDDPEQ